MGASFRNIGQILALAGCDLLTISPELLDELMQPEGEVPQALTAPGATHEEPPLAEAAFRYTLNDDAMAIEKLAEGIRVFAADSQRLEQMIAALG